MLSVVLLLYVFVAPALSIVLPAPDHALSARQAAPSPGQTDIFQVYPPVLTPSGSSNKYGCVYTKVLMEHNFAYSYGQPFVGT